MKCMFETIRTVAFKCVLLLLFFQVHLIASETSVFTSENKYFEIIGSDLKSVSFINDLSLFVADTIQSELSDAFDDPPRKVLIRLRKFKDIIDYKCTISDQGYITLNFNWVDSLKLEHAIEGLTFAFLQSYCFSNFGNRFLDQSIYKAWSVRTLSAIVELRLRPRLANYFYAIPANALSEDFFTLSFLPRESFNHSELSKSEALMFWKVLKQIDLSSYQRRSLLIHALKGNDSLPNLNTIIRQHYKDPSLNFHELFGQVVRTFSQNPIQRYETLKKSKDWLNSMTELHIAGTEETVTLHQLWETRSDASIQALIEARLQLLSLVINRVNPVYYNALQSLALVYQTLLVSENEWDTYLYLSDFLKEFDQAQAIHQRVDSYFKER